VANVSSFVDNNGTHKVNNIGQFADKCTSITYSIGMHNCVGRALCITEFLSK
jgi:hypothetical protein